MPPVTLHDECTVKLREKCLENTTKINLQCQRLAMDIEKANSLHQTTYLQPLLALKEQLPAPCNTLSNEALEDLIKKNHIRYF